MFVTFPVIPTNLLETFNRLCFFFSFVLWVLLRQYSTDSSLTQEQYDLIPVNCTWCRSTVHNVECVCLFVFAGIRDMQNLFLNISGSSCALAQLADAHVQFVLWYQANTHSNLSSLDFCISGATCSHVCISVMSWSAFQLPARSRTIFKQTMINNFPNVSCLIFCSLLPLSLCKSSSPQRAPEPLKLHPVLFWSVPYRGSTIYF